MQFSPPHRFGVVQGIFFLMVSVVLIPTYGVVTIFINQFGGSNATGYLILTRGFGIPAVLGWTAYTLRVTLLPLPEVVLIEKDEKELMQRFGVRTLKDAAEVTNLSEKELLKLLASNNVLVQEQLIQLSLSEDLRLRYVSLASRRAAIWEGAELPTSIYEIVQPGVVIRSGKPDEVAQPIVQGFFGGEGGQGEPIVGWIWGSPDDHCLDFLKAWTNLNSHAGCRFGHGLILTSPQTNVEDKSIVEAACICYPPGALEDWEAVPVGGERWLYAMHYSDGRNPFIQAMRHHPTVGRRAMAVFTADFHQHHKEQPPHWYIHNLAVHPDHRNKRRGKILLDFVAQRADADQVPCYLECGGFNVPFYKSCGYNVVWTETLEDAGKSITMHGMLRPPKQS